MSVNERETEQYYTGGTNRRTWGQLLQFMITYHTSINDLELPVMNHIT